MEKGIREESEPQIRRFPLCDAIPLPVPFVVIKHQQHSAFLFRTVGYFWLMIMTLIVRKRNIGFLCFNLKLEYILY